MKFLVDAQLSRKNFTTDQEVTARAKQDGRIVVSKDAAFASCRFVEITRDALVVHE